MIYIRKNRLNESLEQHNFVYKQDWGLRSLSFNYIKDLFKKDGYLFKNQHIDPYLIIRPTENIPGKTALKIRAFVFIWIKTSKGKLIIPFYTSSGSGDKKEVTHGAWFPLFGVAENYWLCKTNGSEMMQKDVNGNVCPYGIWQFGVIKKKLDDDTNHFNAHYLENCWQHRISEIYVALNPYIDMKSNDSERWTKCKHIYFGEKLISDEDRYIMALDSPSDYYESFFPNKTISGLLNNDIFNITSKLLSYASNYSFTNTVQNSSDHDNLYKRIDYVKDLLK